MVARWFRIYEDVIDDPKVILLPEGMRWCWIALLCLASKNGGRLPSLAHVAVSLRLSERRASALLARLHAAGLLDRTGEIYAPHNWGKRQYKSDNADPTAPQRKLRHRSRPRGDDDVRDISQPGSPANSTDEDQVGTAAGRSASVPPVRPETETETESDSKTDSPQSPPQPPRRVAEAGWGNGFELEGKGDIARGPANAPPEQADIDAFTDSIAAIFARAGRGPPDLSRAAFWLRAGFDREVVLATIRQLLASKPAIQSLNYFDAAILRAQAAMSAPRAYDGALVAEPEFPIEKAVAFYARTKVWSRHAGPEPGTPGCRATPELLARHGLSPEGEPLPKHSEGEQP